MNIVIDTNVIASALYFGGKPDKLVDLLMEGVVDVFVSDEIIDEYYEIAARLSEKYTVRKETPALDKIISQCNLIQPTREITVCRDPDDNKFIECATEAHCIYIVSGDKDLLDLQQFEDIEILTVSEFFERYDKNEKDKKNSP